MDEQTNGIFTACRNCYFAEFEDNKQTGCKLNILDKVAEKTNKQILPLNDNGVESKTILDFSCLRYRTADWGAKFSGNYEQQLQKEVYMKWHAIVFCDSVEDGDKKTDALLKMDRRPDYLSLVYPQDQYIYPVEMIQMVEKKKFSKWYVQVVEKDYDALSQIDIAFDRFRQDNYSFYSIIKSAPPEDHYQKIHDLIFEEFKELAYIEHDYGSTFFKVFHLALNGNAIEGSLAEKIDYLNSKAK